MRRLSAPLPRAPVFARLRGLELPAPSHEPDRRDSSWALRSSRSARGGGNGRGLSGSRREVEARGRGEGAAALLLERSGEAAPLRAGGPGGGRLEPSQHPGHLRHRHGGGGAVHRLGAAGRRNAARAPLGRSAPGAQGDRLRPADRSWTRGGAREGDRAPRPEAREPLRHAGRARQDPRLRSGILAAARRGRKRASGRGRPSRGNNQSDGNSNGVWNRAGRRPGDAGLHVARAGAGPGRRCSIRHLRVRRDPLRDALGKAGLPRRVRRRHDERDPDEGAAGPLRNQPFDRAGA